MSQVSPEVKWIRTGANSFELFGCDASPIRYSWISWILSQFFIHSRCRGIENKSLPLSIISFILEIFEIETVENSVTLSILTTRALVVKYMKQYLISFKEKGGKID